MTERTLTFANHRYSIRYDIDFTEYTEAGELEVTYSSFEARDEDGEIIHERNLLENLEWALTGELIDDMERQDEPWED